MSDIASKAIVLKLNRNWMPVGYSVVSKALVDLCAGEACMALDIDYGRDENGNPDFDKPTVMHPVDWDEWIELPIRSWDLEIHSPSITIRVPTVIIAKSFAKMPVHYFKGKPGKRAVWRRDKGIDQYTGRKLKEEDATLDHVIPSSKGGRSTWENLVITDKRVNWKKGNKSNEEVGLKLIKQPKAPDPMPASALIREVKHVDWKHFLKLSE
jgi:5-methylcytosine-specific restriction endonuclease McrA